jgi:hypothetical protein
MLGPAQESPLVHVHVGSVRVPAWMTYSCSPVQVSIMRMLEKPFISGAVKTRAPVARTRVRTTSSSIPSGANCGFLRQKSMTSRGSLVDIAAAELGVDTGNAAAAFAVVGVAATGVGETDSFVEQPPTAMVRNDATTNRRFVLLVHKDSYSSQAGSDLTPHGGGINVQDLDVSFTA